ncbi:lipase, class 3 [Candidatus Omnitrophus magneticus]|uniref:Lipase, class 3 n=1 Tax=Candidatus Omnitrophus magneticus TaxID=1609969 RepID=A0A0F0CLK6_9BACT|nr:lipase, class 3 [Candidatus Omnitrophus magneticus]
MYFQNKKLLVPPVARAAYSDRMAWLMSEMSRLAYVKFERDDFDFDKLINFVSGNNNKKLISEKIQDYIDSVNTPSNDGYDTLKQSLEQANFELIKIFSNCGTQAFLAKRDSDKIVVLAFRGTELKDLRDIKADLDAKFYKDEAGVKIHNGFRKAFSTVEYSIRKSLEGMEEYSLYITGHSLGGALAIVATRALNSDNIGACYTFGNPKVGVSEFGDEIKSPIYRVVNAFDIVPSLPFTYLVELVLGILWGVSMIIPFTFFRNWITRFIKNFRGYEHHGDMRFLTPCVMNFSELRLISNYNDILRSVRLIQKAMTDFITLINDHGIIEYSKKLEAYALKRLAMDDSPELAGNKKISSSNPAPVISK